MLMSWTSTYAIIWFDKLKKTLLYVREPFVSKLK
jgi:hypothetical protein